ncbi:hypothetical protein [Salirhabdus salicampi]|nr:hypothetical protein [Salirhabdus salicampi]MCP8618122.1 hypothetical protein [Salirhabdus salicampi]
MKRLFFTCLIAITFIFTIADYTSQKDFTEEAGLNITYADPEPGPVH